MGGKKKYIEMFGSFTEPFSRYFMNYTNTGQHIPNVVGSRTNQNPNVSKSTK